MDRPWELVSPQFYLWSCNSQHGTWNCSLQRSAASDQRISSARSRDEGLFLLSVIWHASGQGLALVLILAKNEEQILALERRTNSFSWTVDGGRVFKAYSGSLSTCNSEHATVPLTHPNGRKEETTFLHFHLSTSNESSLWGWDTSEVQS